MFDQYRSIPGQAKLLIALSFIPGFALSLIYTDLSYFLTSVRGLSITFTGLVITVMGLTVVATSIPFGILADRFGRRKFIIVGNLLASITLASFALTATPVLLILAAVVEGSTEAAFASAGTALLAEKAGEAHRTAAFSLSAFLSNIGWGLSGFAIPLVLVFQSFGLNNVQAHVILYLALAASSVAITPLLFRIDESRTSAKAKSIREFMPRKSRDVMVKYAVTAVLIAFGAGLFVPLMTLWFSLAFRVPDTVSGPVIGVSGFLIAAFTLGAPNLARRFGLVKSIVLTEGLSMIFMIAVPIAPTFALAGGILHYQDLRHEHLGPARHFANHGTRGQRRERSCLRNKHGDLEVPELHQHSDWERDDERGHACPSVLYRVRPLLRVNLSFLALLPKSQGARRNETTPVVFLVPVAPMVFSQNPYSWRAGES